jgi:hypothetical protein
MGRTAAGNRCQGHFQDQARQLTPSAIGRAILWAPQVAVPKFSPIQNALGRGPGEQPWTGHNHIGVHYDQYCNDWGGSDDVGFYRG